MAFLCPVRIRRNKKKHGFESTDLLAGTIAAVGAHSNTLNSRGHHHHSSSNHHHLPMMGRITGSASIETLVRVGIEKEHGLSPDSKMLVLHDFTPLVDDELEVHRGQVVNILYQENDWVYVLSEAPNEGQEGFIPFSYCAPYEAFTFKRKMPRSGPGSVVSGLGGGGGRADNSERNGGGGSCIEFNEMPVDVGGCDLTAEVATTTSLRKLDGTQLEKRKQMLQSDQHFYDVSSSLGINSRSNGGGAQGTIATSANVNSTAANISTGEGGSSSMLPDIDASIVSACSNGHLGSSNISSSLHNNLHDGSRKHNVNGNTNGLPFFLNSKKTADNTCYAENISNMDRNYKNYFENFKNNNIADLQHNHNHLSGGGQLIDPSSNTAFANFPVSANNHQQQQLMLGEQQIFFKDAIGRFIVLYPFTACDENEINVERGEVVTLLNKDDPDWCWVMRSDGQEGFVSGLYICPTEMLYNAHHNMMLANQQQNNAAASASEVFCDGGGREGRAVNHQLTSSIVDNEANLTGQSRIYSAAATEPIEFKGAHQGTTVDTGYLSASASQVGLPISGWAN